MRDRAHETYEYAVSNDPERETILAIERGRIVDDCIIKG